MIKPPPIRENLLDTNEKMSRVWTLWFQALNAILSPGASGTFTTADAKTVTVVDGIITKIV